jgi:PAS domain S-box-containing protein
MKRQIIKPTIVKKVSFLLFLLTLGGILSLAAFFWFLAKTAYDVHFINVAGRQRMLSEQLRNLSYQVRIGSEEDRDPLRDTVDEFDLSLRTLEHGGRIMDRVLPPAPPEILDEITEVKRIWDKLKTPILLIATGSAEDPEVHVAYTYAQLNLPLLREASNRIVSAYESRTQTLRKRMLQVVAAIAGIDLVLLVVGTLLTRNYITRPILLLEKGTRHIREGDYTYRIPILTKDELATLTHTFNEMSAEIESLITLLDKQRRHNGNIVASVPSGLVVLSADLRVVCVNRSFLINLGFSRKDVLGKYLEEVLPIADLRGLALDVVATGKPKQNLFFNLIRGQETRILRITITTMEQIEKEFRLLLIIDDITEFERLRTAVEESEQRFRNFVYDLVHGLDAIVWEADVSPLRFSFVSQGIERILGYPVDVWLSEPDFCFKHIYPDDQEQIGTLCQLVLHEDQQRELEYRMVAADGRIVWLRNIISPVRDTEGKVQKLRGIMMDITERKQLEEQFLQSQKMEAIGRLAGGIAHDFNNLLTVIRGYTDLLLYRIGKGDPGYKNLLEISKATDRAASLSRQLLAFSRRQVLQPKMLDLNTVVTELEKMLRRLIGEDIDMVTILDPTLGYVKVDPVQIEQAIMNLVVNSRDAMPKGGKLIIKTENLYLDEAYTNQRIDVQPGHYVMLSVSDTGCGMDEETMSHIFEPFFTTKESGRGTGLGLATVYGIVKQSGGHIEVYSEINRGTTFKIYLPRIIEEDTREPSPNALMEKWPGGSETILVVEDEEGVRALAREVLKEKGYKVLEASGCDEAISTCEQISNPIHLLLIDMVMPKMSGHELAKRLLELHPEIKVIYMSGYADDTVIQYGALESDVPFLQKPFTPTTLLHKVREVLDAPPNKHQSG